MYAYMRGELAEINPDHVVLDVNGIGYRIYLPTRYFDRLVVGENVKIFTHLSVREDAMVLYGFLSKDDLTMFKLLIGVSGIGPKGGIAILSMYNADDIRFAILSGDAKTISKASGIGPKTAQRVIIDLKDKVSLEEAIEAKFENENTQTSGSALSQARNDAILALNALGYSQAESLKVVSKIDITPEMDVEDILRLALKNM